MLEVNLTNQINHAFKECEVDAPSILVSCENNRVLVSICEKRVISFDMHSYAYLGYQEMADFVKACWKKPRQIVDLFGMHGGLSGGLSGKQKTGYSFWTGLDKSFVASNAFDLPLQEWKEGDTITVMSPLVKSMEQRRADNKGFLLKIDHYEIEPFGFSPQIIVLPGSKFNITKVDVKITKFDNYGDLGVAIDIGGIGETV